MGTKYREDSLSDDERGRPATKRADGLGLSNFYRERFGSHSPEEYMNLRISGFDEKLERDEIKDILSREFRDFRPFEIKVVRQPGDDERLAYVNFERRECARKIRYSYMERLKKVLGKRILCDPAGILRDQEGKYIPDRFNRQLQGIERDPPKRRSPDRGRSQPKQPNVWRLKENDNDATRTLFVGNMPQDIREAEIRRTFERYGQIEDIDIKTPANTDAAYAFIMFQTMEQAVDAKHSLHDRAIRSGGPRCKIGYGKSQVSKRLWVGGLGLWTSTDMLAKEFDRYGLIEKLEYEDGAEFGYIRFADVNAAQDAYKGMKGFPLGGKSRCILVDFAKDDSTNKDPLQHIGGTHLGHSRKRKAESDDGRTPPSSPKTVVTTFEELDDEYATTWQGQVILKKSEYAIKLYRIAGAEKMLQKMLRDEDGNAVKLHVQQRLSLSNQDSLYEKLTATSVKQIALMIGVGKQMSELKPLIKYLHEKHAAGVVTTDEAIVYLFPSSDMALRLLSKFASSVRLLTDDSPFLLFVLCQKGASNQSTPC